MLLVRMAGSDVQGRRQQSMGQQRNGIHSGHNPVIKLRPCVFANVRRGRAKFSPEGAIEIRQVGEAGFGGYLGSLMEWCAAQALSYSS